MESSLGARVAGDNWCRRIHGISLNGRCSAAAKQLLQRSRESRGSGDLAEALKVGDRKQVNANCLPVQVEAFARLSSLL